MKEELNALLRKLNAEEADLTGKLEKVRTLKAALTSAAGGTASKPRAAKRIAATGRKRAPAGALGNAIKLALAANPKSDNAAIRETIKATGYAHPIDALHVSKILGKLVGSKEIKFEEADGRRLYSLA